MRRKNVDLIKLPRKLKKLLKKIVNRIFKTRLTTAQLHLLRDIYRWRDCAHCSFLVEGVSWWCSNNDACQMRDTNIPGVCHCPYWKPDKKFIKREIKEIKKLMYMKREKTLGNNNE